MYICIHEIPIFSCFQWTWILEKFNFAQLKIPSTRDMNLIQQTKKREKVNDEAAEQPKEELAIA